MRFYFGLLLFTAILSWNCNDRKPLARKRVDPGLTFLDYRVNGNEEMGEATVRLQFFEGEEGGRTIRWSAPAGVHLDGETMPGDSSKMNGFYYESRFALEDFAGPHEIRFTDRDKHILQTEFTFRPITLTDEFPAQLSRKEHWIRLGGIDSGSLVRMLLIDTSFYSRGIDKVDTVQSDSISLTPRDFENLRNGPVYLEILHEQEIPIGDSARKITGRLAISYTLKRNFLLRDSL